MANIADKVSSIRKAIYGKDVRESIASGIEDINTEVENTTSRQNLIDSQEQTRINKENTRQSQESTRQSQESTRQSQESTRQTNENSRQQTFDNNENTRQQTFDNSQITKQQAFNASETSRTNTFNDGETNRTNTFNTNETTREQAEIVRQNNETARQDAFDAMVHTDPNLEIVEARGGKPALKDRFIEIEANIQNIDTSIGNSVSFVSTPSGQDEPTETINEYNFIDHIESLETEMQSARNGETNLNNRLNKFDTSLSESMQQIELRPIMTTANISYYVDSVNGNDTTGDGTSGAPFATIVKAVSLLPQIINHAVAINVLAGTYTDNIIISGFCGRGSISLNGSSSNIVNYVLNGGISINNCNITITITGFKLNSNVTNLNIIAITNCIFVNITSCNLDGNNRVALAGNVGVKCASSKVLISNCDMSNYKSTSYGYAIYCATVSEVFSNTNTGTNNQIGLCSQSGSTIAKYGTQPTATTAESAVSGGVIR